MLKTLSLLLVIFLHAAMPFTIPFLFWEIYADVPSMAVQNMVVFFGFLVIPSFMFCSGFLFSRSALLKKYSVTVMLKKRFMRLVVPWFLTAVLWMAPLYTLFDLPALNRPVGASFFYTLIAAATGQFNDYLWFLQVLFWVTLFWIFILPLVRKSGFLFGLILSVGIAFLVHVAGRGLSWFGLWETTGPLIYFYLGCMAYEHRKHLPILPVPVLIAVFLLLLLVAVFLPDLAHDELISWVLSGIGALSAYQLCLHMTASLYPVLQRFAFYRFFETYSFRYYLFHLPSGLLLFLVLYKWMVLPVMLFIVVSFVLNMLLTTLLVVIFNQFEAWFIPRRVIF